MREREKLGLGHEDKDLLDAIEAEMSNRGLGDRMARELAGVETNSARCLAAIDFVREHAGDWLVTELVPRRADAP